MKAEALNEYYGPSQEVYDAINAVRIRAGIPTVEESYSNPEWVTDEALNKHLTKEGMREIILRERANELSLSLGIVSGICNDGNVPSLSFRVQFTDGII